VAFRCPRDRAIHAYRVTGRARAPARLKGAALLGNSAETATRNATNSPLGDLPEGENG
jgi:hypothetical protein